MAASTIDLDAERAQLLAMHAAVRRAHYETDPAGAIAYDAEACTNVRNGEIRVRHREDELRRFVEYFAGVTYDDDLQDEIEEDDRTQHRYRDRTEASPPSRPTVRTAIQSSLAPADQASAEFVDRISKINSPATAPASSSGQNDITYNIDSQVLFGKLTPAAAAAAWLDQMKASMAGSVQ